MKNRPLKPRVSRAAVRLLLCAACRLTCRAADAATATGYAVLEPTVTQEESALLASATALAESDIPAALRQLSTHTGPQASPALDFARAALFAQEKAFAESQRALEAAVAKLPSFRRAWLLLGRVQMLQGQTGNAPQALCKALALGGDPAEAYKLLAFCHLSEGLAVAAESAYRTVLALAPADPESQAGLARALLAQSRFAEAAPLLRTLSERNPENRQYWTLRAETELGRDNKAEALVLLECARRLGALSPPSFCTLGDLYFNNGLYGKAAACYQEAAATGTLSAATGLRYAEALLDAGQPILARQLLDKIETDNVQDSSSLSLLRARLSEERGDLPQALALLEQALRADPLSGEALLLLAHLQRRQGQDERALLTLERAVRTENRKRQALLSLAQLYADRADYGKATEKLEEAQALQFDAGVARYLEQIRRSDSAQSTATSVGSE